MGLLPGSLEASEAAPTPSDLLSNPLEWLSPSLFSPGNVPKGAPCTQLCFQGTLAKAVSLLPSTLLWRIIRVLAYSSVSFSFNSTWYRRE